MAESVFARIARILSGSINDTVDSMEAAGSDSVMREAIREVDRVIDQAGAEHAAAAARRLQIARQRRMLDGRMAELTDKARAALAAGREDLAEAALSRQIDFEAQAKDLDALVGPAREEEDRLTDALSSLKLRKQQMEQTLAAFLLARRDAAPPAGPARRGIDAERQVERAERAFSRAMAGAGGVAPAAADIDVIRRVAEIDRLQRNATIADRLAALRGVAKAS